MSMIYIPSNRFPEGELPRSTVGLEGWITLRARSRYGLIRREHSFRSDERGPFHNLITNRGLNLAGAKNLLMFYFHVGTGTTPPAEEDVELGNYAGSLESQGAGQSGNAGAPDYYAWRRGTYINGIGDLGNVILTECGVGGESNGSDLWSRELIRDSNGNPSSFPISSDEQLEAIYEARLYPPLTDVVAQADIGPSTYEATTRAINVNSQSNGWGIPSVNGYADMFTTNSVNQQIIHSGDLVPITTAFNSGTLAGAISTETAPYVTDSFENTISTVWGSGSSGNVKTIRRAFGGCTFQVGLDPVFVKDPNQSVRLYQKITWARR